MLRRILIIILVAVVIIVAILGIRWFLNRDSGEAEGPDADATAVVEESVATSEEDIIEEVPETESSESAESTTEESTSGEASTETDAASGEESGEATSTEVDEAAPVEEPAAETGGDMATGEDAGNVDPNAAEGGDVASESGTGGLEISQPIAFVQPGVPTQHSVDNLEWLTQLARCYGTTVADIQAANNYACPDLIAPGWVINIQNPGNAGPITINDAPCFVYHTVQVGETLYSISNQYGIHYQWVARINAIYNYDYIYAGQTLVIPNPIDPVFTQPPATPYFCPSCGWQPVYPEHPIYWPPVPEPYGQ